jgi:hypothetical protein
VAHDNRPSNLTRSYRAGERARETDARPRRFRTAVHHSHFLDRRHPIGNINSPSPLSSGFGIRKKQSALSRLRGLLNNTLGMPRIVAPTADVIDVFFPSTSQLCAFARSTKNGSAATFERAHGESLRRRECVFGG